MPPVIGVSRHALWEVIGLERDGKPETRKPARGGLLGVFRRLSETATRRRLNWTVRSPYLLGMLGVASVRHTRGHTRCFLLASFSKCPRRVKQHPMVADVFPSS